MDTQGSRGYTLIELLIVCAIISAVTLAVPTLSSALESSRQQSRITELQKLVQLARSTAVNSGATTTLCGSMDGSHCEKDWTSPTLLIFVDKNNNHAVDDSDEIIYQKKIAQSRWYWRGSNRAYLRFRPDGLPMEKGHFTLCPVNHGSPTASKLVLNWVGRTYISKINLNELPAGEPCV